MIGMNIIITILMSGFEVETRMFGLLSCTVLTFFLDRGDVWLLFPEGEQGDGARSTELL